MRDVLVAGIDMIRFGKYPDISIKSMTARVVEGALRDAGLDRENIQAAWFANSRWGRHSGQDCIRGQVSLWPLGIDSVPIINVENACAGGSTAFHGAWMGIASGL